MVSTQQVIHNYRLLIWRVSVKYQRTSQSGTDNEKSQLHLRSTLKSYLLKKERAMNDSRTLLDSNRTSHFQPKRYKYLTCIGNDDWKFNEEGDPSIHMFILPKPCLPLSSLTEFLAAHPRRQKDNFYTPKPTPYHFPTLHKLVKFS